jgi:Bacteriophage Lambda NinG protein
MAKAKKAKKKPKKQKKKSLAQLKKIAWSKLSLLVRLDGASEHGSCWCYTCGERAYWREMQAGHAIGGRHMAVLFDEEIIRPQCVGCNIMKRGNYPVFATRLIREHGAARGLAWFEGKIADSRIVRKVSSVEMQEKIDSYDERLRNHPRNHLLNN